MQQTVTVDGQEVTLATITVGMLETIELTGKKGHAFSAAFVAASILAAGDKERGTEAWVNGLPFFNGPLNKLLEAANEVNGFNTAKPEPGEPEPEAAPAAAQ